MKSIKERNEEYKKELDEYIQDTEYLKIWNKMLLGFVYFILWLIFMVLLFFSE